MYYKIEPEEETLYETFDLTGIVGGVSRRLRLELRYLYNTDRWYVSMFDSQSGDALCRYVPVVTSKEGPNDLFEPFKSKKIGKFYCVPNIDDLTSQDPRMDNISDFSLLWGDDDAE